MREKFHFGKQIKKIRVAQGITQLQLGERIGRTQALISYVEKTGKANEDVLYAIAKILGVSIEQVLNPTDETAMIQFNKSLNKDALYIQMSNEIKYLKAQIEDYKEIIKSLSSGKANKK